jgi:hypothetical protein
MSEGEIMVEGNGLFACGLDELIGSDDYLERPEVDVRASVRAECRIRFNVRGPGNLRTMPITTVVSSDGFDMDVDRLYTWAPAPIQTGPSVAEVEEFVSSVFRHSKSWMASGIALRRVPFEEAQCIVKYVGGGQTRCGQGAVGCTSGPDSRRLIEMVEEVTFGKHKGLMHELIHAFGHGAHNQNPACPSVMGMAPPGIWPTSSDLSSTRAFAH